VKFWLQRLLERVRTIQNDLPLVGPVAFVGPLVLIESLLTVEDFLTVL